MNQQKDKIETPPAVETPRYEGPPKNEQRIWNLGTTTLIAAVAVVIILIYVLTR